MSERGYYVGSSQAIVFDTSGMIALQSDPVIKILCNEKS